MGQRFVVLVLFVGLVGICFCGCENQGQKVERLIKELKHRKAKVRANAAMALFNPPNAVKGAVPALIPLLQDEDATVRANAIYSLGCIGESSKNAKPIIVPALIQALHQDARICANVATVLMRIGTPEAIKAAEGAVPTLIQALQDPDVQVRANAIYALDSIVCALDSIGESTKDAVSALMLLLKDQNVRLHALKCIRAIALRQIGTPEAVKVAEGAVPALIQALQDPDIQVRANAIYALDFIGESATDAVPALILLLKDLNEDVRLHALEALGQIGSKDAVSALTQALKGQDEDVRLHAVQALEQIGTPEALKAVEEYQSRQ